MNTPQISRSGRVLKKSAKVKEMEYFNVNDSDMQSKSHSGRTSYDYVESDEDDWHPLHETSIKIPKISLNLPSGKQNPESNMPYLLQRKSIKPVPDQMRFFQEPSPNGLKESENIENKLIKVWSLSSKKAIMCSNMQEMMKKGSMKLNILNIPNLKAFLKDGTELDDDEVFQALPPGTVVYLLNEDEEKPWEVSVNGLINSDTTLEASSCGYGSPIEILKGSSNTTSSFPEKDENVDRKAFLSITNDDLKELGFKLGNRKKLLSIIESERNLDVSAVYTIESNPEDLSLPDSPEATLNVNQQIDLSFDKNQVSTPSIQASRADTYLSSFKYENPKTIPVLNAVTATERGRAIMKSLSNGKTVSQSHVREIVRLVLSATVEDLGTMYLSCEQKLNVAKAIVMAIPQLKNPRDDCEGYEQFFDPVLKVGMIEWRLKTMRLSLTPSKKKYTKRKTPTNESFEEDVDEFDENLMEDKINWLKYQKASDVKKTEIFECMADTYKIRRRYIKEQAPSITEVLSLYPKFKDFQGELIEMEFSKMFPNAETFLGKYPSNYTAKILKYCREVRIDIHDRHVEIYDENLSSCLMLADLLHNVGLSRKLFSGKNSKRKKFPSEYIIKFPGENIDFESVISDKENGPQPYLICQGDRKIRDIQLFIVLDKDIVEVGSCPVRAIDLLYKSHYIFNVKFCKASESFYLFMDFIIYKIKQGPCKSSIENLNMLISRINL